MKTFVIAGTQTGVGKTTIAWLMGARVAYTYNLFTGFASVYNLADRMVIDNGGVSFTGNRYNPAPGRSFLVGGEVSF